MNKIDRIEIEKDGANPLTVTIKREQDFRGREYKQPTESSMNRLDNAMGYGEPDRVTGWRLAVVYTYSNSILVKYVHNSICV